MAELASEEEAAAGSSGDGEAIQVYLRLKPSKRPSSYIKLAAVGTANADDGDEEESSESGSDRRLPQVRAEMMLSWFWQ